MTLYANYAAWVSGVKDWLDADHLTDAQIGSFISLAQDRMNRELSVFEMEATVTLTAASGSVTLPANFNRIRQVSVAGVGTYDASTKGEIVKVTADKNEDRRFFAIDAGSIIIWPTLLDGAQVTVDYYVNVPSIGAGLNSNVFSDSYANLLLYASMAEGSNFIVEDDRAQGFEAKYLLNLEIANQKSKRVKLGSTPLRRVVRVM